MEQAQQGSETKARRRKEYSHEPKIITRARKKGGGRVFYIEHCRDGERVYERAHPGTCRCGKPSERRPCEHQLLAQRKILDFKVNGLPSQQVDLRLAELFRRYNEEHKGELKAETLNLYGYGQKYFQEFLDLQPGAVVVRGRDITAKILRSFKTWLREEKNYSECYVSLLLRGLRATFFWALSENYLSSNPLSGVGVPRNRKIVPRRPKNERERNPLTPEEIKLIEALPDGWLRDMALVFLFTGMRKGEAINLPFAHVSASCIRIHEIEDWEPKQHERREIPLHPRVVEILNRRRAENPDARFVFETEEGNRHPDWKIQEVFRALFDDLKIVGEDGVGVTIHCFRHSFATKLLADGVPPTTVRDILGHKDLETTLLYYHRLTRRSTAHISRLSY